MVDAVLGGAAAEVGKPLFVDFYGREVVSEEAQEDTAVSGVVPGERHFARDFCARLCVWKGSVDVEVGKGKRRDVLYPCTCMCVEGMGYRLRA